MAGSGRIVARASEHVDLARPPEDVWAYVTDLPRTPEWRTSVREVEGVEIEGVGTRFRAATRVLGKRWEWVLEVTAWSPYERFSYVVTEGSFPIEVTYDLQPSGTGTRFTLTGQVSAVRGPVRRAVLAVAPRLMARDLRGHLANLQRRMAT